MLMFPHQFKLLGVISWCIVANMVSEPKVSSSNPSGHDYQNKFQSTPISLLRPTGAAREGEC
jgi:hypothetical protein